MALRKELKSDKGITATYHRIGSVVKNHNKIEVTVKSYADETYRDKEKKLIELSEQKDALIYELSQLTVTPEENAEKIAEVEEKLEKYNKLSQTSDFSIFSTTTQIPYGLDENVSFADIYKYLSESDPVFSGADLAE